MVATPFLCQTRMFHTKEEPFTSFTVAPLPGDTRYRMQSLVRRIDRLKPSQKYSSAPDHIRVMGMKTTAHHKPACSSVGS
jgi:hypothetical protein